MALLFSKVAQYVQDWRQRSSLLNEPDATAIPQSWHQFDQQQTDWISITPSKPANLSGTGNDNKETESEITDRANTIPLTLMTWNVDAMADYPERRMLEVLSAFRNQSPQPNILFFQEVPKSALASILGHSWIRNDWYSSERDATQWSGQQFATITLLSKQTFNHHGDDLSKARIGQIWRVKYPSRFGRDALCCHMFVPPLGVRVRLVNVHLDSLPIQPSLRPRQLAIIANMLHAAGRGVVAGDFNPVLPGDDDLVSANRLVDVWTELHQTEGFTWGIDGQQPFPPARLDKFAMVGLKATAIDIIHPGVLSNPGEGDKDQDLKDGLVPGVPWSDHSGLRCSFSLVNVL
ncbi:tyrosyl-DNA phosphodiesterase 2 [Rhypophila decipiens]|uniref:Tyrosyl-DNA phosphodiesterase 2 n=1 Tax=Rhypophila decipiens TaxID=261697 RepID=A0AAN7B334_9PEZI|nr:tyrosyl-DNA phosphodiesterase 2 [Rhypophila decipiens]